MTSKGPFQPKAFYDSMNYFWVSETIKGSNLDHIIRKFLSAFQLLHM